MAEFHKIAKRMGTPNLEGRVISTGFLGGRPVVSIYMDRDETAKPTLDIIARDFTRALGTIDNVYHVEKADKEHRIYDDHGKLVFSIRPERKGVTIAPYCSKVGEYDVRNVVRAYVNTVSDLRTRQENTQ